MGEGGRNVLDVSHSMREICDAIRSQVAHGPYPSESIYGDGCAGERIASILANSSVSIQKHMSY